MRIRSTAIALAAFATLTGCNENTAPGNDRAEQVDPAPTPAPVASASEALSGIATSIVQPQMMTGADIAALGGLEGSCVVRLTEVAYPSFYYDRAALEGVVKLNGKLIPLEGGGGGSFASGDLRVVVRPLEEAFGDDGFRPAEMFLFLPGAEDELAFRGFEQCHEIGL